MLDPKPCRHQMLAFNPPVQVQRCLDCGCVSVHLGALTVRLDDGSLEALSSVLGEACAVLRGKSGARSRRPLPHGVA